MTSRKRLLSIILIALALYMTYELGSMMMDQRARASDAWVDLQKCRAYASRIRQARQQLHPQDRLNENIAGRVRQHAQQAAKAIGLAAASLKSVRLQPPQSIGESAYAKRAIRIRLSNVTPKQMVAFMHNLSKRNDLTPAQIAMIPLRRGAAENLWNVDIVFTYVVIQSPIVAK